MPGIKLSPEMRASAIVVARRAGLSFSKVAKAHNITRSRAQQIYQEALQPKKPPTAADELTARIRNALVADGCEVTPEAVRQRYTDVDIKRLPNLGALSLKQLNDWLIKHGQRPLI
jgi:DNA-directed RNA polymerase alpha subunit